MSFYILSIILLSDGRSSRTTWWPHLLFHYFIIKRETYNDRGIYSYIEMTRMQNVWLWFGLLGLRQVVQWADEKVHGGGKRWAVPVPSCFPHLSLMSHPFLLKYKRLVSSQCHYNKLMILCLCIFHIGIQPSFEKHPWFSIKIQFVDLCISRWDFRDHFKESKALFFETRFFEKPDALGTYWFSNLVAVSFKKYKSLK